MVNTTVAYFVWVTMIWRFFDSDLALNYVKFGSEHRKLVGNHDRRPDTAPMQCALERPFCVCQVLHFLQISRKTQQRP